jgi:hypothetical protein
MSNFVKIRPVGTELFRAEGRTDRRRDMTKLIVFFQFANAHNSVDQGTSCGFHLTKHNEVKQGKWSSPLSPHSLNNVWKSKQSNWIPVHEQLTSRTFIRLSVRQDMYRAICKAEVNIKLLNLDCPLYHVFPKQIETCELYSSQYTPSDYRPVAGNDRGFKSRPVPLK